MSRPPATKVALVRELQANAPSDFLRDHGLMGRPKAVARKTTVATLERLLQDALDLSGGSFPEPDDAGDGASEDAGDLEPWPVLDLPPALGEDLATEFAPHFIRRFGNAGLEWGLDSHVAPGKGEDRVCVVDDIRALAAASGRPEAAELPAGLALVAVCDGHSGAAAAHFTCRALPFLFVEKWSGDAGEALAQAFAAAEQLFCRWARRERDLSGACVTAAAVSARGGGGRVVVANAGDCRTVAGLGPGRRDPVEALSEDHTGRNPAERARVQRAGGWFENGRVHGILEPSRCVGDIDLKTRHTRGWLVADPDVREARVQPGGCLVLASDGVFDVVSSQLAVGTARDAFASARGWVAEEAARDVVTAAVNRGSLDDITAVVVRLSASPPPSSD